MRQSSPVAILLFALASSRLDAQEARRELPYRGCYALKVLPPGRPDGLALRQIELTIEPKRDDQGRLWDFETPPPWRSVRIVEPATPDVYGGWGWRVVRKGHIEMEWVANGGPAGTVSIKLEGSPEALVGTSKYTSDDFSGPPAIPIRAERIACATPSPK